MKNFKISDVVIGRNQRPFIIAEMSGNHNQSLGRALSIVEAAAKAGAHAIKLQTYTADTMTLNVDSDHFKITDKHSLWHGRHLYDLYQEAHTPWEWHAPIMQRSKELGLICFSTPFDETAVDFLETLNVPAYKIASFENTDVQLLKKIASTGKPVIASTGMSNLKDLQLLVSTLRNNGCEQFILLKCTSAYPACPEDANLKTIPHLSKMFSCQVGLSDHTMGIGVALAAVVLPISVIEKHLTLSRAEGGVDAAFSMEPDEFALMVKNIKIAWESIGHISYGASQHEDAQRGRRSLYFVKKMAAGEVIKRDCVKSVRPGFGLPTKYFDAIEGLVLTHAVEYGDPVKWQSFKSCKVKEVI